jgi:hypothetical protein
MCPVFSCQHLARMRGLLERWQWWRRLRNWGQPLPVNESRSQANVAFAITVAYTRNWPRPNSDIQPQTCECPQRALRCLPGPPWNDWFRETEGVAGTIEMRSGAERELWVAVSRFQLDGVVILDASARSSVSFLLGRELVFGGVPRWRDCLPWSEPLDFLQR